MIWQFFFFFVLLQNIEVRIIFYCGKICWHNKIAKKRLLFRLIQYTFGNKWVDFHRMRATKDIQPDISVQTSRNARCVSLTPCRHLLRYELFKDSVFVLFGTENQWDQPLIGHIVIWIKVSLVEKRVTSFIWFVSFSSKHKQLCVTT